MADAVLMSCEIKELGPSEEIIKLLECPICQGIPIPPIWNCIGGHSVCDQCHQQLQTCGLCRLPFSGGRNYFMESILYGCKLSCPYNEAGCTEVHKGDRMKVHAAKCEFGPKIKWIACQNGHFPEDAVQGGMQNGVKLYVVRSAHHNSITPGKLYEYAPPGTDPDVPCCSLAWGGGERVKVSYEVLVAPRGHTEWISSSLGAVVPLAIRGGTSEYEGEPLFIGRVKYGDDIINGKIHPSHKCCYIGVEGMEKAFESYEILVSVETPPSITKSSGEGKNGVSSSSSSNNNRNGASAGYYS